MSELKIVGKVEVPPKPPEPVWHAVCKECGSVVEAPRNCWEFACLPYVGGAWGGTCPKCRSSLDVIYEPAPDHLRTES